jgi:hypothetical protein
MLAVFLVQVLQHLLRAVGATSVIPPLAGGDWPEPHWLPRLFVVGGESPFFSARVSTATVVAMELLSITVYSEYGVKQRWLKGSAAFVAAALVLLNAVLAIAFRQSWTFDVVIAIVVARYCTITAHRLAPWVDACMP